MINNVSPRFKRLSRVSAALHLTAILSDIKLPGSEVAVFAREAEFSKHLSSWSNSMDWPGSSEVPTESVASKYDILWQNVDSAESPKLKMNN